MTPDEALAELRAHTECHCALNYTTSGRHHPDCAAEWAEDVMVVTAELARLRARLAREQGEAR